MHNGSLDGTRDRHATDTDSDRMLRITIGKTSVPTQSSAIARGVTIQLIARLLALPLSILTLGLTARYLGPEKYGALTGAIVFVGIFQIFSDLGVSTAIVRRVASKQGSLPELVGQNLSFSMAYTLPLSATVCLLDGLREGFSQDGAVATAILSVGLSLSCVGSCFDSVFDARIRYGVVVAGDIASRILCLVATLVVVTMDDGLVGIALVQLVTPSAKLISGWAGARQQLGRIRLRSIGAETFFLLREAFPFALMSAIGVVYWRVDGLILSTISSEYEVAAYGIALNVAFSLAILPNVFGKSIFSTIARYAVEDAALYRGAVNRGYELMFLLASPVAVFGLPLAAPITKIVASDAFVSRTAPVLQLFFVAVALGFLTAVASVALIATSQQRSLTILSCGTLVLNIVLNLVLVRAHGAQGAGISLIATEGLAVAAATFLLLPKGVKVIPFVYLGRLVPGLLAGWLAIIALLPSSIVLALVAAAISYAGLAWAFGAVPRAMVLALGGALKRLESLK